MKIIRTTYRGGRPIQIQDHGVAFVVVYPDLKNPGYNREKVFSKTIGGHAWNNAQKFAKKQREEAVIEEA